MPQLRKAILQYSILVATANNVKDASQMFAVEPTIVQKMREDVRLKSSFLQKINMVTVTEKAGEIIGLTTGLIGSNTDTTKKDRETKSIHKLSSRKFYCEQTNFDTSLRYNEIDQWAHMPNFPEMVNSQIAKSQALSLISIGNNGIKREKDTDIEANPLLQDVAKGWLQKMREENPQRVMKDVEYGPDKEIKSLDAVVEGAINEMIAEEFADRDDLVVICNKRLLGDKYYGLINAAGEKATEVGASDQLKRVRRINELDVETVPYFPQDTILITPLKNLSIYMQKTGERRQLIDNPKRDQIENYHSKNIDFIVEEYGAAVLIEGLKKSDAAAVATPETPDV